MSESRTLSRTVDAEHGRVEDNRGAHRALDLGITWHARVRKVGDGLRWSDTARGTVEEPHASDGFSVTPVEPARLWLGEAYFGDRPAVSESSVVPQRVADIFFASGVTGLPLVQDRVHQLLGLAGVRVDPAVADSVRRGLWMIDDHLQRATDYQTGYRFRVDDRVQAVGEVVVRARIVEATGVSARAENLFLENVRTAIDAHSSGHPTNRAVRVGPAGTIGWEAFGIDLSAGVTFGQNRGQNTGRTGLAVMVPRIVSPNHGYRVQLAVEVAFHSTDGRLIQLGGAPQFVPSSALVRMTERDAQELGFPLPPGSVTAAPGDGGGRGGSGRGGGSRGGGGLAHLNGRRGIGVGVVEVTSETADKLRAQVTRQLSDLGFLPRGAGRRFEESGGAVLGPDHGQLGRNLARVEKFLSRPSLDSHHDQIRQDGLTFTLDAHRGASTLWDARRAIVTVTARPAVAADGRPSPLVNEGPALDTQAVGLGMSLSVTSHGYGGRQSFDARVRGAAKRAGVMAGGVFAEVSYTRSSSNSATFVINRPELVESAEVDAGSQRLDWRVDIAVVHVGVGASMRTAVPSPRPVVVSDEPVRYIAPAFVGLDEVRTQLPLPETVRPAGLLTPVRGGSLTPVRVGPPVLLSRPEANALLNRAGIMHLDTSGLYAAVAGLLPETTGPGRFADDTAHALTGAVIGRAFFREMAAGELTTDTLVEPGLIRDAFASVDISARIGRPEVVGKSRGVVVTGDIDLMIDELESGQSRGWSAAIGFDTASPDTTAAIPVKASSGVKTGWSRVSA